jgi:hypothetical protein
MNVRSETRRTSRREFFIRASSMGAMLWLGASELFPLLKECPGLEPGGASALRQGWVDARTEQSLKARFRRIGGGEDLPYIARNLKLVLGAPSGAAAAKS